METESDAVRAGPALPCSLLLLRLLASGCFSLLLLFCCSPAALAPSSLLLLSSQGHWWAGQSGTEAEGPLLVLLMHSWICSSGRCEYQGSTNNGSGCKAAGGVQMAALICCALHCRLAKCFWLESLTLIICPKQASKLLLDQGSASASPCLLLKLLHPWPVHQVQPELEDATSLRLPRLERNSNPEVSALAQLPCKYINGREEEETSKRRVNTTWYLES